MTILGQPQASVSKPGAVFEVSCLDARRERWSGSGRSALLRKLAAGIKSNNTFALFAVVHGARIHRLRGILLFATLCLGVGTFFESVSLRTGFPFGYYRFTNLMGPKVFDLPILLALAYLGMGYLSWVLGLIILGCQDKPLSGRKVVLLPLVASFIVTAWDLSMDPVWADIDHAWVWRDGGSFYGVPISNFFGWFLAVYVFYQLFALYLRNRVNIPLPTSHWRLAILFYVASAAGNLLVVAPLISQWSLRGCSRQTMDDRRDSLGISPRFSLSHDASCSDCLGQSRRISRAFSKQRSSGDFERVTGNSDRTAATSPDH